MSDDVFNDGSVTLDLDPAMALLLRRVVEAGLTALQRDISADQREQLGGLCMFLGDAATYILDDHQRRGSRLVA